jgi:hypothetical protein
MKNLKNSVKWLCLLLCITLISTIFLGCWGSPTIKIIFENQSGEDLTIYVFDINKGTVVNNEQLTVSKLPLDTANYRIKATNNRGKIIFSENMTREKMVKINSRLYKVLIKQ